MKALLLALLSLSLLFSASVAAAETPQREAQVIAGTTAPALPPGMASLQLRMSSAAGGRVGHFCGGTLIARRWVLTAAHCVDDSDPIDVLLGTRDLRSKKPERRPVVRRFIHPGYSSSGLRNDIALLYLGSASSRRTALRSTVAPAPGDAMTVYGWGATSGNFPNMLQQGSLTLVPSDHSQCSYWAGNSPMFCASSTTQAACRGDSGGPAYDANGRLAGVVSFGGAHLYRCMDSRVPSGFARVDAHRAWIDSYLRGPAPKFRKQKVGPGWATVPDFIVWNQEAAQRRDTWQGVSRIMNWGEVSVNRAIRSATLIVPNQKEPLCTVAGYQNFPGINVCYTNGRVPLVIADGGGMAGVWFYGPNTCYRGAYYLIRIGRKQYKRSAAICF